MLSAVSGKSNVFAYSRFAYKDADGFMVARTPSRVIADLRQLLKSTGHQPPYVLVGHSLGGTYMLEYALRYPHEVSALVLIDARHPNFTKRCKVQSIIGCEVPSLIYYARTSQS